MTDRAQHDPDNKTPRMQRPKENLEKVNPTKKSDYKPAKNNPINPETDEPTPPNEQDKSKIKNPIQENPGKQITG